LAPSQPLAVALEDEPAPDPEAERTAGPGDGPSVLGSTLVLRGELRLAEDLIIEGRFDGSITQGDQRLSIGEHARVTATVRTGSAVIAGFVDGDVRGSHTVVVKKTATLRGALTAERLSLDFRADLEDVVLSGKIGRPPGR
jgi:cytoskeletal protein CcmA (bactofilin family)